MNAIKTTKRYFELSNESDFNGIAKLLTDSAVYDSQNTGLHSGRDDIISMQKDFHHQFNSLGWKINGIKEVKPNVVTVDYDFLGKKSNGDIISRSGLESVTVKNGKIVRIEIRNKV